MSRERRKKEMLNQSFDLSADAVVQWWAPNAVIQCKCRGSLSVVWCVCVRVPAGGKSLFQRHSFANAGRWYTPFRYNLQMPPQQFKFHFVCGTISSLFELYFFCIFGTKEKRREWTCTKKNLLFSFSFVRAANAVPRILFFDSHTKRKKKKKYNEICKQKMKIMKTSTETTTH